MNGRRVSVAAGVVILAGGVSTFALAQGQPQKPAQAKKAAAAPKGAQTKKASADLVKRGEYLVTVAGCNDCHTPLKMGKTGPEPDMTRMLSGHPADLKLPPPPKLPEGPWNVVGTGTLTAWAGPWGVSYAANLTSDKETGIGAWDEKTFINSLRQGKHVGIGRPLLPPMPWMWVNKATDEDLKAMFAYLQTTPPIRNRVPAPVLPQGK